MLRTKRVLLIAVLLTAVIVTGLVAGCVVISPGPSGGTEPGSTTITQAWDIIFRDYVDKSKLDPAALSRAAIKGMLEELNDPHTAYIDPDAYNMSVSSFEGKIYGIGAQVGTKEGQIVIIAPIPGSPADRAGIRPGDVVKEINGQSTEGMSLNDAVLMIRGDEGTTVEILIQHQGETEPKLLSIVRAEINLESVSSQMMEEMAYIRISYFSERTDEELLPVIRNIGNSDARGIILDLRANPGGVLDAVITSASYFLKEGVVTDVVDNEGNHRPSSVQEVEATTDLPMVVLVDAYSASGSEVLAGALQDHERATVAGKKTFGKGSVNILRRLNDGSGIYITTGRWLTPNGRLIEGEGLVPDIELEETGEDALKWAIDYLRSSQVIRTEAELQLACAGTAAVYNAG